MRTPLKKRIMCETESNSRVFESHSKTKPKGSQETTSLQDAFLKFRRGRQKEMKDAVVMEEKAIQVRSDPVQMANLRRKFLEGCKRYFGIPYAKRYHEPGTPMYESPLFLDCCGLIRQVLRDLKEDFGFRIGPWNQSYMFDTLPVDVERAEDMKPGDLVFISGTYFNLKSKKQRHDMVHVEVWLGEGEQTIGARWQKGKVQVFDSYKFVSKSYHSMKYYFKSIDTWLTGVCKSFCTEHLWRASPYMPGKKSVFALDDFDDIEDEAAGDDDSEGCGDELKGSEETGDEMAGPDNNYHAVLENEHFEMGYAEGLLHHTCRERGENGNCFGFQEGNLYTIDNATLTNERTWETSEQAQNGDIKQSPNEPLTVVFNQSYTTKEQELHRDFFIEDNNCSEKDATNASLATCLNNSVCSNGERDLSEVDNPASDLNDHKQKLSGCSALSKNRTSVKDSDKTENYQETFSCHCPGCSSPRDWTCIHSFLSRDETCEKATCVSNLASCAEFSTSLECFEVISDEQYTELEKWFQCCPHDNANRSKSRKSNSPTKDTKKGDSGSSNSPPGRGNGENSDNGNGKSPSRSPRAKSRSLVFSRQPGFYIGGGNGNWMIESAMIGQGWRKIEDRNDESFKLKWVECKGHINYNSFREGEQLVNHISNINLLTTKMGLLTNLQEYERVLDKTGARQRIQLSNFVPETHCLMNLAGKMKFIEEIYKDGETWICKPTGLNQGKGIYLISNSKQLRERLLPSTDEATARRVRMRPAQERIIQRYIMNPLLLDKRKFDIRTYMLIGSTVPYVVLYHTGYVRLSCVPYTPYSPDTAELHAHLTNQFVQKKSPLYQSMKEDTVWDFDQLQEYIDKHHAEDKGLPSNWVFTAFTKRMQQIMLTCFQSVRQKLHRRMGTFDLLGFDFMIDDDFKVWLIEINVNPALHTNCQVLKDMLPSMVDETLKIVIEIFEKSKKRVPIFPLKNLEGFRVLYNGEGKG